MSTVKEKEYPAPGALATPTNLENDSAQKCVSAINPVVADAFALYVKTKNFHWHLYGPRFRDLHLLFDEQAAQILATVDELAERSRKLGGTTIRSIGHIAELTSIKDDNDVKLNAREMVKRLRDDNLTFCRNLREAHEVCSHAEDVGTSSLLEEYIDQAERRIWFLNETLQED